MNDETNSDLYHFLSWANLHIRLNMKISNAKDIGMVVGVS